LTFKNFLCDEPTVDTHFIIKTAYLHHDFGQILLIEPTAVSARLWG